MENGWDPLRGGLAAVAVLIGLAGLALFGIRAWFMGAVPSPSDERDERIEAAISFDRCEVTDDSTVLVDLSFDNTDNEPYLYVEVAVLDAEATVYETSFVLEDMQPGAVETAARSMTLDGSPADPSSVHCELSYWSTTP